jgi:hypothetical protein
MWPDTSATGEAGCGVDLRCMSVYGFIIRAMAFTVYTSEDSAGGGMEFEDGDRFTIFSSGVLEVESKTYGTRIYAPGFWQLVQYRQHRDLYRTIHMGGQ